MRDITSQNFGLLIAYVIPGMLALWGLAQICPPVDVWLHSTWMTTGDPATVGGFLYLLLGSIASGLTVSTLRWLAIDRIHQWTGLRRPGWDDSKLQDKLAAFEALVDNHYRYYQFYSNGLVALIFVFAARMVHSGRCVCDLDRIDGGILFLFLVYWAGSRDTLRNYYTRAAFLLGTNERTVRNDERTLLRHGRSRGRQARAGGKSRTGSAGTRKADPAADRDDD